MYMDELSKYLRREAGEEESPLDTPVDGDIADMGDLGFRIEKMN